MAYLYGNMLFMLQDKNCRRRSKAKARPGHKPLKNWTLLLRTLKKLDPPHG